MPRNVIQATFDDFMKAHSFHKRSGSWYNSSDSVISLVNLQKSQYGPQYFINVAGWLRTLGDTDTPKEKDCHIRTRLGALVAPESEKDLDAILNLEHEMADRRRQELQWAFLSEHLLPALEAMRSVESLRSPQGRTFLESSLVDGEAFAELGIGISDGTPADRQIVKDNDA